MSVRNFERVFTREVGATPSHYVLQVRVEAARRLLERTDRGLKHVATETGFVSVDLMRRAFVRLLGIAPGRYRDGDRARRTPALSAPVAASATSLDSGGHAVMIEVTPNGKSVT